jgi:SlyX protein
MTDEMRLTEIESKLAFHEETLRVLNDVLYRQQQEIDQLEHLCRALRERWDELTQRLSVPSAVANPETERPPHY